MPHIIIEYTDNLQKKLDFMQIFPQFHIIISQILPIDIELCRSRAVSRNMYYIGSGDIKNAHIHLNISVLEGHNKQILQDLGAKLMRCLNEQYDFTDEKFKLQTTCEIKEINKDLYFK